MGKNIDKTFIQSKMLNQSKGPAVHSLRAQADKSEYSRSMRKVLENTDRLTIRQTEVTEILVEEGALKGVKTISGAVYYCKAAVLCTGVYLNARCIYGEVSTFTGPSGLQAATHLTDSLKKTALKCFGSRRELPPESTGDPLISAKWRSSWRQTGSSLFFFHGSGIRADFQVSCWLTYTNERTHEIIRENLDRSPLFSGEFRGQGPDIVLPLRIKW